MVSNDQILFGMKRALLEYGLRYQLDFLVKSNTFKSNKKQINSNI